MFKQTYKQTDVQTNIQTNSKHETWSKEANTAVSTGQCPQYGGADIISHRLVHNTDIVLVVVAQFVPEKEGAKYMKTEELILLVGVQCLLK